MGLFPEFGALSAQYDPTTLGMLKGGPTGLTAFLQRPGLRQALLATGSALLQQKDQPGSLGGALGRALPVGMQAFQQGQQQSKIQGLLGQLPPGMQAVFGALPPEQQSQALMQLLMRPPQAPDKLGKDEVLLDPVTHKPIATNVAPTEPKWVQGKDPIMGPDGTTQAYVYNEANPNEKVFQGQLPKPDAKAPPFGSPEWKAARAWELAEEAKNRSATGSTTTANMKDLAAAAASANNQLGQLDVNLTHFLPEAVSRESAKPGVISGGLAAVGRSQMTNEEQVAQAAGLGFIEPAIRYLAGGRLTDARLKLYAGSLLPQPGEGKAVIQAKRDRRAALLQAMSSGELIGQPNPDGTPNEANVAKVIADLEAKFNSASGPTAPVGPQSRPR